jgi:hypothetical protein
MLLQPMGMPGLLQPQGPADPVQRLALMMALMVLGMPQVYSCHISIGGGLPLDADMSEPRVCPPIGSGTEIGTSAVKEELDKKQWTRLPAVHCVAMQSSLSLMCGLDGQTRKVRYDKFRQPCGVQPAACWEALSSVADPDPGSGIGCFLTPGSGIRDGRKSASGSGIRDPG